MSTIHARAWVFGDDVDTDLIYHNKYLAETDPKNMPQYINERCYVTAMVAVQGNTTWMCNRFNYTGNNWVFYNKIILSADGEKFEKDIGSG